MTIDEFKKNIAPFMRKGWVAMDKGGEWRWWQYEPVQIPEENCWWEIFGDYIRLSLVFNIEPVEDWTQSLIEVGK